MLLSRKGIQ